jgi:hypothetical protein
MLTIIVKFDLVTAWQGWVSNLAYQNVDPKTCSIPSGF